MLRWEIINNTIARLYYNHQNIIKPWGIETADSSAFFSLEKDVGYRYKTLQQSIHHGTHTFCADIKTKMREGQWHLQVSDKITDAHNIIRRAEAVCLEDSYFMDFVMRFRFKKKFIKHAEIADKKIIHNNTNVYNQYPVNKVVLQGSDYKIKIDITNSTVPEKMKPFMYVRDADDEWVVHVRMLPEDWDKEIIKVCNRWAQTRPLPLWMSRVILNIPSLKKHLWYRNEVNPYKNPVLKRMNLNAFPMVKLLKGDCLMWEVNFNIG